MKKTTRISSFIGEMLTAIVLCGCIGVAAAASEAVSFNTFSFYLNGMQVSEKGQTLTTASGASIPSSITYTDANGGTTSYIPVRKLADALHMPVDWNDYSKRVTLKVGGEAELYTLPSNMTDVSFEAYREVAPIVSKGGKAILAKQGCVSADGFSAELPISSENGRYINVTVTNNDTEPVKFTLGLHYADNGDFYTRMNTCVPAGKTVTRTLEIDTSNGKKLDPLYIFVGYDFGFTRPVDISISAVQF